MGRRVALSLAGLVLCVAAAAAQADRAGVSAPAGGAAACRFVAPEGWDGARTRWLGPCRDGHADGRGLLREYEGGQVARIFFGQLRAGEPTLGVIDLMGEGFRAGRFEAGRPVQDGERNTLIQAFDEGAAAAREAAAYFGRLGREASARFYRDKARQLAEQMD